MERKSKTTRNHTRVNNLTMISSSRSRMKHVIYINSEKLPGKSRPRSIPSLIKRDILRRKRYLIWSVKWFPFGLWPNDQWFQKGCDKVRCYRKKHLFPFLVSLLGEFPRASQKLWLSMIIHEDHQKTTSMAVFMTWNLRKMIGHELASVAVQDVSCS